MKLNNIILFALLSLAPLSIASQEVILKGIIKDSLNTPIESANVLALDVNTNNIITYTTTNSEGKYQLILNNEKKYLLRISYLGFIEQEIPITIKKNTKEIVENVTLYEKINKLNEIELVYKMPITISGDTITYKTDAFTNGNEKKLKDVLKKLPGIEVDKNGNIKIQGRKVSKLMVEGKDFFDGDPKLATKNLPGNAIDKVEVLRNYNKIRQTKGLNNDETIALNIKLKDGKKNLLFGDIEVGSGVKKKYFVHPNIFYYSPKTTLNIIGDLNNIGEQAFTLNDYFRFSGGLKNLIQKGGVSLGSSSDELGISFLKDKRAKGFNSKLVAFNFNHSFSKKFQLQGLFIASSNKTILETNSERKYIRSIPESLEIANSIINQKSESGLAKLSLTYEQNKNLYLNYDGILKRGKIKQKNTIHSVFNDLENDINATRVKEPFSINQNFETYYTLNSKNIFSFEAQHLYKKQMPNYNLFTSQQPFIETLPLIDENSLFNITQFEEIKTNKVETALNYYTILNKKSHLNLTIGNVNLNQKLTSSIDQSLVNTTQNSITDVDFNNNVSYAFSDFYTGLHYKLKTGKFILNPGLNLHFFNIKDKQIGTLQSQNIIKLLPDFYTRLNIKKSESLTFRYSLNTDFASIDKRAKGAIITNYNSLSRGNQNLSNDLYHQYSLQYFNFKMFSFTNISVMLNYSKKFDDIKSSITYLGNNLEVTPMNTAKGDDYLTTSGSFEKRFGSLKINLKSQGNFTNFNNQINGILNNSKSTIQNHEIALSSNFDSGLNFEIGFSKKINNYNNNGVKNTFFTDKPFVNIEIIFLKNFTLVADYEYYKYRSENKLTKNSYDFLNANLYYQQEGSKFEFKISSNNLTNTKLLNQDNFSDYVITTSQYFVQPRFFMFTLKYNI